LVVKVSKREGTRLLRVIGHQDPEGCKSLLFPYLTLDSSLGTKPVFTIDK